MSDGDRQCPGYRTCRFFIEPGISLFSSPETHLSPCALEQAEISWFLHSYTNHAYTSMPYQNTIAQFKHFD
jgi:hypothetical protein